MGRRLNAWNTNPMRSRRSSERCRSDMVCRSWPWKTARPPEGKRPSGERSPIARWQRTWLAARRAVARAWTADAVAEDDLPPAGGHVRERSPREAGEEPFHLALEDERVEVRRPVAPERLDDVEMREE